MDSELTEAWRKGDLAALERLGAKIGPGAEIKLEAGRPDCSLPAGGMGAGIHEAGSSAQPSLVSPGVAIVHGKLVAMIPAVTRTEANESKWVRKMQRKLSAKEATRRTLGPHAAMLVPFTEAWHRGDVLKIVFTRLGGRKLDRGNLPSSMKAVEDVLEGALLASDGDPRWRSEYEQEPGHDGVGVRIEIELF